LSSIGRFFLLNPLQGGEGVTSANFGEGRKISYPFSKSLSSEMWTPPRNGFSRITAIDTALSSGRCHQVVVIRSLITPIEHRQRHPAESIKPLITPIDTRNDRTERLNTAKASSRRSAQMSCLRHDHGVGRHSPDHNGRFHPSPESSGAVMRSLRPRRAASSWQRTRRSYPPDHGGRHAFEVITAGGFSIDQSLEPYQSGVHCP
jgi:hypothetical protein